MASPAGPSSVAVHAALATARAGVTSIERLGRKRVRHLNARQPAAVAGLRVSERAHVLCVAFGGASG